MASFHANLHWYLECEGGPYHGERLALQSQSSFVFSVNEWHGFYVHVQESTGRHFARWRSVAAPEDADVRKVA